MKSKKFAFVLILIAVLVAGWLITLKAVSGIDEMKEQNALVDQADTYNGKQLFVRGIPLLEDALNINTKNNADVQRKLLDAYREYGDVEAYYNLLQVMDKKPEQSNVTPGDYLSLAQYYLENGSTKDALIIAKEGMEKHDDESLKQFFEQYRYESVRMDSDYEQIQLSKDSKKNPAYDGSVWNYIGNEGQKSLSVDAQEAVTFNTDGYGVVKINNRYVTILENGDLYGLDETGVDEVLGLTDRFIIAKKDGLYGYYNYDFELMSQGLQFEDMTINSDGVTMVKKNGKWGIIDDSGKNITDYIYEDIARNSLGCAFAGNRAMVKKNGRWTMINTAGEEMISETFSDAKAPESEGLIAVADESGKWGFINNKGELVIDYQYYDASSFSCDMAAVMVVNNWGYISAQNVRVIEDDYLFAEPFHNGVAVVNTYDGTAAFIKQRYFDLEE